MKTWDHALRGLAAFSPSELSSFLLRRPVRVKAAPTALASIGRELDFVGVVRDELVLHVEFESRRPTRVAQRLRLVNALLGHRHDLPVLSVVVSLRGRGPVFETREHVESVEGEAMLRFRWRRVNLGSLPSEEILRLPGFGALPLVPLTREGGDPRVLERTVRRLERSAPRAERGDLLALLLTIGALHHRAELIQTLVERPSIMKTSTWFQEWQAEAEAMGLAKGKAIGEAKGMAEGKAKGMAEGKAKGMAEGKAEAVRAMLESLLALRFGPLPERARRRLATAAPLLDEARAAKEAVRAPSRTAFFAWLDAARRRTPSGRRHGARSRRSTGKT